jgi:hypothetical protein
MCGKIVFTAENYIALIEHLQFTTANYIPQNISKREDKVGFPFLWQSLQVA